MKFFSNTFLKIGGLFLLIFWIIKESPQFLKEKIKNNREGKHWSRFVYRSFPLKKCRDCIYFILRERRYDLEEIDRLFCRKKDLCLRDCFQHRYWLEEPPLPKFANLLIDKSCPLYISSQKYCGSNIGHDDSLSIRYWELPPFQEIEEIEKIEKQEKGILEIKKTKRRSNAAIIISILALIVSIIFNIIALLINRKI